MSSQRRPRAPRARPPAAARPAAPARPGSAARPSARPGSARPGERASAAAPAVGGAATATQPPRLLTVRAIVLFVVLLVAFVLLFPTVRAYLAERQQLQELRAEAAAAAQRNEDLEAEIARWEDPAFIAAQARERLAFVLPGETPYRVIDPEVVQEPEPEPTGEPAGGVEVPDGATGLPWYAQMWTSVRAAGELSAEPDGAGADGSEQGAGDSGGESGADGDDG